MGNKIIVGIIIFIWILGVSAVIITKSQKKSEEIAKSGEVQPTISLEPTIKTQTNMDELKIEDIKIGSGLEAVDGKSVTVNYKGTLLNGTQFDSSYDRGTPFTFNLGAGEVIQGWDLGVKGMKIGGKRKLTIPSELGYGARAIGTIPANSTLIFEVELLKVE